MIKTLEEALIVIDAYQATISQLRKKPKFKDGVWECEHKDVIDGDCCACEMTLYEKRLSQQKVEIERLKALDKVVGEDIDIEPIAEQVHKAYCQFKKDKDGEIYWTKGDYNLLEDKWKEADRYTVRAVLKYLAKYIREKRGK